VLAEMDKRGTVKKQPLQSSPFVLEFKYGANAEGYWTYDHMVLQFKDCVDMVKVLYPEYDYMFLFYYSCGHNRKRPDSLCVHSTMKGFWGKQMVMRDMKLEEYLRKLEDLQV
jgi:hypothetical protein